MTAIPVAVEMAITWKFLLFFLSAQVEHSGLNFELFNLDLDASMEFIYFNRYLLE